MTFRIIKTLMKPVSQAKHKSHTHLAHMLDDAGYWQNSSHPWSVPAKNRLFPSTPSKSSGTSSANSSMKKEVSKHRQTAMEIKESIGYVYGQAILANNLGDLKRHMGDYEHAKNYFRIALEQFALLGSDYGTAVLHMNMGAVSLNLGLLAEARSHLEQSKRLFEHTNTEEFLAELYRTYAELAFAEQSLDEALDWANQSVSLAQRLQARFEEGATRRMRSHILQALGQKQQALTELRHACAILEEVAHWNAMAHCLLELARMTDNPDESAKAVAKAQQALESS